LVSALALRLSAPSAARRLRSRAPCGTFRGMNLRVLKHKEPAEHAVELVRDAWKDADRA